VAVSRLRLPFAALVAIVATATSGLLAQQAPTFTSSTRLVTVAVSVMRGGEVVTGLTRDDFQILSNGQIKPIVQFTSEPGPVTTALLVDASGSMAVNRAIGPAVAGVQDLLRGLDDTQDRAGIFTFERTLTMRHDFGPISPTLMATVSDTHAFGSTSLFDAILSTSRALAADGAARRAVVVYTDGVDTSSVQPSVDVSAHVAAIDVPVYVVAIGAAPEAGLDAVAHDTGGQLFTVTPGAPMQKARTSIITQLRQHYLLAFEPDVRPGWHRLSVRTRPNHTVRARAGYSVSPRS